MDKKQITILIIMCITLVFTACTSSETPQEFLEKSITATKDIEAFEIDTTTELSMKIMMETQEQNIMSKSRMQGIINIKDKELDVTTDMTTIIGTQEQSISGLRTIVKGNMMYMSSEGSWMKQEFKSDDWNEFDMSKNAIDLISTYIQENKENINIEEKDNTIVVKITNPKGVTDIIPEETFETMDSFDTNNMNITLKFDKDTYILSYYEAVAKVTTDKTSTSNKANIRIKTDFTPTTATIQIPEKATEATDISKYIN